MTKLVEPSQVFNPIKKTDPEATRRALPRSGSLHHRQGPRPLRTRQLPYQPPLRPGLRAHARPMGDGAGGALFGDVAED